MEAIAVSGHYGGRIDLLLTDIVMPGMTISEMILQFLALRPATPVLRMSGYPERLGAQLGGQLENGTPYLQKPFTPQVLLARIRKVLDTAEPGISNYRGRLEAFG
jgi:DNA-binding response OmpR family regulator